ncbi:MAG: hypothetical protein IGS03_06980 [Candidatus Sericytochromatia bacterium]|nr:hypothetical protein [Candidatus Sericytochromatia bacterium]
MTIQQLLTSLETQAFWLLLYLLALPLGSLLLYLLPQRARSTGPWPYIYSTLVYLSCGPGVLSALLIGYSLFFILHPWLLCS